MPWLVKDEETPENGLLFVHVPRCGGTSLTKHFQVPRKAREGRDLYHKIGLTYFFYRYKLLENRNFPVITIESCFVAVQIGLGILLYMFNLGGSIDPDCTGLDCPPGVPSILMWTTACLSFVLSTFIFTAPIAARTDVARRAYIVFVGHVLHNWTASIRMLTGVGTDGYIVHFTAQKMIDHGGLTKDTFARVDNFSIVRNPYSRMVSLYMYNRFGPLESFEHFVRAWSVKVESYRKKKSLHEWDAYCHVLPEYEYTHMNGKQLVSNVIRQEDLKATINGTKSTCLVDGVQGQVLPRVLQALKDMPHANRRKRDKPWQDYYNEETMRLVIEMYDLDFAIFGYDLKIPGRPDLDHVAGAQMPPPFRSGPCIEDDDKATLPSDASSVGESSQASSEGKVSVESPTGNDVFAMV